MRPFSETEVVLSMTPSWLTFFPASTTLARGASMKPAFVALPAGGGLASAGSATAPM